ncbi:MAG: TipAS antibiotic-recognition domain-containing protein [Microbacteriaceae bacterium]
MRQRWGDDAWERSAKRRGQMTEEGRRADDERSLHVNAALRESAESNVDPMSDAFQALVGDHYKWVTEYWNGRKPNRDSYAGLSRLYVTDSRFAATYGGQANAEIIRTAIQSWIETNLP